jgi:hypothetical protein
MASRWCGQPVRYKSLTARLNYNRVVMAIYWLSEFSGTVLALTNDRIAAEAGLTASTVARYLRDMELNGVIAVFHRSQRRSPNVREIVLLDHPDARHYLCVFAVDAGMVLSPHSRRVRVIVDAIVSGKVEA